MRIVLTHLTRMEAPRICIAGIDPDGGRHVRPTTGPLQQLTRELLAEQGGPFALGSLVDLGEVKPDCNPPETEDHRFWPDRARVLGRVSPARYLELLDEHAQPSLETIFGTDLVRHEWTYAIDQDRGVASLGVLRVRRKPDIAIDKFGKLRLRLNDAKRPAFLPVTDVRFVQADHRTVKADVLAEARTRMRRGVDVLLMVGLARAFQREGDECARHWLQVNGVCLADRPLGDRP
jgi:Dual OB-containing domain